MWFIMTFLFILKCVHCTVKAVEPLDTYQSTYIFYVCSYVDCGNCPDDYLKAHRKAKLAEDTSNLESEAETASVGRPEKLVKKPDFLPRLHVQKCM